MKIEISYKNSLIGSLSAGESLALHLNGSKLTDDLIVRAVSDDEPQIIGQLEAPSIQIVDNMLYIYDESEKAEQYNLHYELDAATAVVMNNDDETVSLIKFTSPIKEGGAVSL